MFPKRGTLHKTCSKPRTIYYLFLLGVAMSLLRNLLHRVVPGALLGSAHFREATIAGIASQGKGFRLTHRVVAALVCFVGVSCDTVEVLKFLLNRAGFSKSQPGL